MRHRKPPAPEAGRPAIVANENNGLLTRTLAPYPAIDRFPTIVGSHLSLQYLAATYRVAQNGYRQQVVDALDELLERDGKTYTALSQRTLPIAVGSVILEPAPVADKNSAEGKRAAFIAADLQRRWNAIPGKTQAIYSLVFASLYYGAAAWENHWRVDADGWNVTGFGFVHSRRIAWPDQNDWSAHIWDQGSVMPMSIGLYPTENFFGLRIRDVPGKFALHTPSLRADYPTRDGLGRILGWWMVIKLMAVRGASQFVERFGKPWVLGYFNTGDEETDGEPRAASEEDIAAAMSIMEALGFGSLATGLLPDSIKVTLDGPGIKGSTGSINHKELIALCDEQILTCVRGGTLQQDAGEKGARSLGEVHAEGDVRNARFDGRCLEDTLHQDVIWWLCHLNYPGEENLCPVTRVDFESVSPAELLDRADKLAKIGASPDGADIAKRVGVKLADQSDPKAVRLAPVKPVDFFALTPAAAMENIPEVLEALASAVGMTVSPALKNQLAGLPLADATRLFNEFVGAAKQGQKDAAATGAAEAGGNTPSPDTDPAKSFEALRGKKTPKGKAPPAKKPKARGKRSDEDETETATSAEE